MPSPQRTTPPGRIRYGTSSWSEPSWVGTFYPPGTKASDFLAYYATRFDTVEADVTYYRVPTRAMAAGWARRTPPEFTLSAKFPRDVVHGGADRTPDADKVLRLEAVGDTVDAFLATMEALGEKLGPLVIQLPYFNRAAFRGLDEFLARLEPFLQGLPVGRRYAVEVRNKAWIGPELLALLRARGVALVLVDLVYMPHPAELAERLDLVTADFLYARLIGDRQRIDALTERFDAIVLDQTPRLARWAQLLRHLAPTVRETFVYANNHYAGHAPATIEELAARVRGEPSGS